MPVGGQTAVTCLVVKAKRKPNLAPAKYRNATATSSPAYAGRRPMAPRPKFRSLLSLATPEPHIVDGSARYYHRRGHHSTCGRGISRLSGSLRDHAGGLGLDSALGGAACGRRLGASLVGRCRAR